MIHMPSLVKGQLVKILQDDIKYDAIFVPVGGGGLLAGISAWIRQNDKKIKIIGVEVDDSACLTSSKIKQKSITEKSRIICRWRSCFSSWKAQSRCYKRVCR